MLKSHVCFNIDFSISDYKIKVCISSSCNAEIFEFDFQARHSRCVCKTMRENLMNSRIVQVICGCDFIATVSVNLVLKMRTDGVVFNRISTMDNGIAPYPKERTPPCLPVSRPAAAMMKNSGPATSGCWLTRTAPKPHRALTSA